MLLAAYALLARFTYVDEDLDHIVPEHILGEPRNSFLEPLKDLLAKIGSLLKEFLNISSATLIFALGNLGSNGGLPSRRLG